MRHIQFLITIVIILLFGCFNSFAQVPQSINYQAVLRNASGQILSNQNSMVKFTIHQTSSVGTSVYEETYGTITDEFGLVNLQIGKGNTVLGSFQEIQWGTNSYFLQVQADIGSGYVDLGTTQFVTVPYALVADTALHSSGLHVVNRDATLAGDGTDNNPLNLAPQGAITGQSLKWTGNTWLPADDNDTQQLNLDGTSLTISNGNTVILPSSTGWNLNGNSGTIQDYNFIGTTDEKPLDFRTNNVLRTRITNKGQIEIFNTGNSVFIGKGTGTNDDLSDNKNVFIGDSSGYSNTSGNNNVTVGYWSMKYNQSGHDNTAIGYLSMRENLSGSHNTAVGSRSLGYENTTGEDNTAIGYLSLANNIDGNENTAVGYSSLVNNEMGIRNTSIGSETLKANVSGNYNIAVGYGSMYYPTIPPTGNTTGNYNIAIGSPALRFNSTGNNIIAIGRYALENNKTGSYITGIGNDAYVDEADRTNVVVIGANGNLSPGGNNRVRIGNSSMSSIGGQVGWTTLSDERVKENVKYDVKGLSFIMNLKPATYNYSIAKSNRLQNKVDTLDWAGKYDIEQIKFSGFLAQEVEKAAQEAGCDFSGIDKPENENGLWGLRYAEFVVPLVKGMQEQQAMIEDLQKQLARMQEQLDELLNNK